MALTTTVLFDRPQKEIASLVVRHLNRSSQTSLVTGFATPSGLAAISAPILARPTSLKTFVLGAATYPAFEALDGLIASGIPRDRLHIHLGHTYRTGGHKNPYARFRPMLHSKIYYMEYPDQTAAAFIGSHNLTAFALTGLNGEGAVLLEGPKTLPEFDYVRRHIDEAQRQAVLYSPDMKEAYAWWTREFLDGLIAEIGLPRDGDSKRTILLFVEAQKAYRLKEGDHVYFELPDGIAIDSFNTEVHLFLFDTLPADPWAALTAASSSVAKYTCAILGAENKQGNVEVRADWHIDGAKRPVLKFVPGATHRPIARSGMQQVRAEVGSASVAPFEYLFQRERRQWFPEISDEEQVTPVFEKSNSSALILSRGGDRAGPAWKLVTNLVTREEGAVEPDHAALKLAAPESGSFILVSLKRRRKQ